MGRRNRREEQPEPGEFSIRGFRRTESHPDGQWQVDHQIEAPKDYRCPGCDQVIPKGTPNIVAWREDQSADDRRHWHKGCWQRRQVRRR